MAAGIPVIQLFGPAIGRLRGADMPPSLFGPACASALLSGTVACLLLPWLPPRGLHAVLVVMGLSMLRMGRLRLLGVALLGLGFAGWQADASLRGQLPPTLEGRALEVRGRIVDLPLHDARRTRFDLVVDDDPALPAALRGKRLRLAWYEDDPIPRQRLQAGSRWLLPVKLRPPRGLRNPGGNDAEKQALAARIAASGHVLEPVLARRLAPPAGIDAWRERTSARIAASMVSPSSRYVRALALGDTRALTERDWSRLRAAGLTHLIAISGFHVGLVAGLFAMFGAGLWWLCPSLSRWLPRPFAAAAGGVLGAFVYAAITGFSVPTLRTAVMIAAVAMARCMRRNQRVADSLALGCIVLLLLDPLAVLGAGFWLSFAGVAWLLWSLPSEAQRRPWPLLRNFAAAQAVASLGLLPLTVLLFGQASFAGPIANLVAVPWWSLVVIPTALLGVLADALHAGWGGWFWQWSAWAFDLAWPVLARIADSRLAMAWLQEARWFALPMALLSVCWLLMPRGVPGKPLAMLLWLPLLLPARDVPATGEAELVVVDVGQGLSVLVRTRSHALLYDTGPAQPDGFDAGEHAVVPTLHALGVQRLDAVMLSHGDNDHAGGWPAVARAVPVQALLGPAGSPVPTIEPCRAGQAWNWDGVRFRVLHPVDGFPYLGNETSCVLRVETKHGRVLLTGDIGHYVERALLRREPVRIRNEVVIVPHHGSAGSSDSGFVAATGARLAVVSSGAGNRFGHPRRDVVERWCEAGAEVVDTSRAGALRIWLGSDGLQLEERRASRLRLWDGAHRRHGTAGLCYAPES